MKFNLEIRALLFICLSAAWAQSFNPNDTKKWIDDTKDADLIETSRACLEDCLKQIGTHFCLLDGSNAGGYCCRDDGCTKYPRKQFGRCSDQVYPTTVQMMTCPYEKAKCSGSDSSYVQDVIKLTTKEKFYTLQPPTSIKRGEFCYYQIQGGLDTESPVADEFLELKLNMI